MTPAEYILSTLEVLSKPVPTVDISEVSLKDAVYSKVMSKKFRKLKPADLCVNLTKKAIEIAISENKPIRIVEMFGGNKLWRFNEAPEIDWAELFSLTFFIQWSRLIASVYEPGVIFEYLSQDISVESLNNVPRHETDKYSESFRELIKFVEPYLPPNISVKYTRHFELFDNPDDYYDEMISAKEEVLKENLSKAMVRLKKFEIDKNEEGIKVELGICQEISKKLSEIKLKYLNTNNGK